jgi:hypothetical protein
MTPDWIGWAVLGVIYGCFLLLAGIGIGRRSRDKDVAAFDEKAEYWFNAYEDEESKLRNERAAHEAAAIRCSDAEERLAKISILVAPRP